MRWSSRWLLVLPVVVLGLAWGCCRPGGGAPSGVSAKEAVLADMQEYRAEPPDAVLGHVNDFGTGGALVFQVAAGARIAIRDQVSPEYEGIEGVAISPDGRRVAYAARVQGQMRMVLDGKPGAAFEHLGEPHFSRDGRHLFYRGETGGKYQLVIDERAGQPVAGLDGEPFQLAGRDEVVVVERTGQGAAQEVVAYGWAHQRRVLAGLANGEDFVQGEDGGRLAAVVDAAEGKRVVSFTFGDPVRREEGPPFEEITAVAFDGATGHLMYVGSIEGQAYAVLDGAREPAPSIDVVVRPVFDPVRKAFTFGYVGNEAVHLATAFVGEARPGPGYTGINDMVRSADGRHLAFAAEEQGSFFLVVDGAASADRFDRVVSPRFSPDGRFIAFRARKDGRRFMVVADATGKTIRAHQAFEQVFPPAFTADGKAVAYAVKDGPKLRWRVEPL